MLGMIIETRMTQFMDQLLAKVPELIVALLILFVGRLLVKLALNILQKRFEKRKFDRSVGGFVLSLTKFVLYILLILTVASTVGIQTTSFIAALSAFGLAVGMALQGSLSNFAGGVLILVFKPFEVGDYIDSSNGSAGTVERIDLLYSTIIDDNGIRVFSPNGTLANSIIRNYTKIVSRRLQYTLFLSYEVNIKEAREGVLKIIAEDKRILKNPIPIVSAVDLKETGIEVVIRAWTLKEDFWSVKMELAEVLQAYFDENESVKVSPTYIKVLEEDK